VSLRSVDGTQITQIERMNADWFAALTVFFHAKTQRRKDSLRSGNRTLMNGDWFAMLILHAEYRRGRRIADLQFGF